MKKLAILLVLAVPFVLAGSTPTSKPATTKPADSQPVEPNWSDFKAPLLRMVCSRQWLRLQKIEAENVRLQKNNKQLTKSIEVLRNSMRLNANSRLSRSIRNRQVQQQNKGQVGKDATYNLKIDMTISEAMRLTGQRGKKGKIVILRQGGGTIVYRVNLDEGMGYLILSFENGRLAYIKRMW